MPTQKILKGPLVALVCAALVFAGVFLIPGTSGAFYNSSPLQKYVQDLRGVGPGGIPVAAPDTPAQPWWQLGVTHYTINIEQFQDTLHPNMGGVTTLWGFNPVNPLGGGPQPARHLGGIIVAERGTPVQITFQNKLTGTGLPGGGPLPSIIPVDTSIPGANQAQNRTAVHLHGGFVPWISDGGPFDWWTPNALQATCVALGTCGASFLNNQVLNSGATAGQAEYYYPNDQSARLVWYHDHAWGITRTNAYAGIASAYIIRDNYERSLGLPEFIEASVLGGRPPRELPIVIQDKIFVDGRLTLPTGAPNPNYIGTMDPTWPGSRASGSLWYAHVYDPKLYKLAGPKKGTKTLPMPHPSVVPEFFGDTMLVNGTVYPKVTVEARRYRLRILNACNARVLNLQLYVKDGSPDGITLGATLTPTNPAGPPFLVIGTEGGFLPTPVTVNSNVPFNPVTLGGSLIAAPAERFDVLVDFSLVPVGSSVILYNDAPAPFPIGSPLNDYFLGNPLNPVVTTAGFGPDTRQIMRFDVVAATPPADTALTIPGLSLPGTAYTAGGIDQPLVNQPAGTFTALALGPPPQNLPPPIKSLTLNETFDAYGRLIQLLGTAVPLKNVGSGFGRAYTDPPTEITGAGFVEQWDIYNLTGDTHPIHFHLVNVQIINRQPFRATNFTGVPAAFTGPARPPDTYEYGWKETVRMNPGEVTRVVMKFDLPVVPFVIPTSTRFGVPPPNVIWHEYVWHCHILEHEEHDMMRPLVVTQ